VVGSCKDSTETSSSIKCRGIFPLAENCIAYQEGLCSTEQVTE